MKIGAEQEKRLLVGFVKENSEKEIGIYIKTKFLGKYSLSKCNSNTKVANYYYYYYWNYYYYYWHYYYYY